MESDVEEIIRIREQWPDLSDFGFGVFDSRHKTKEEAAAELKVNRDEMTDARSVAGFVAARTWLRRFNKTKSINRKGSSYGLKHVAEPEIGYTTNGMFIAAAIAEGFEVQRDGPNAIFNISSLAWKRPDDR